MAGGQGRGDNLDQLNGPWGILLVKIESREVENWWVLATKRCWDFVFDERCHIRLMYILVEISICHEMVALHPCHWMGSKPSYACGMNRKRVELGLLSILER